MLRYILKRLLTMIPILLGVIIILFIIRSITPGDPVDFLLGDDATVEMREAKRAELGLNAPLPIQCLNYIKNVIVGDWGESYTTHQPVLQEITSRLPTTLFVCLGAVIIGMCIGIPLGVVSATRQYSWLDSAILVLSMIARAIPGFCLAFLFITIFSVQLKWLPAVGIENPLGYILPMATIGLGSIANYTRITRSSMLEVVRQDYIRTARAKGQSEGNITRKHALRNAFIPVAATIGNQIGGQLGGALIIETVFGVPGIGKLIGDAITQRNYPIIQGGVLFIAIMVAIVNLLVDLSFVMINPRLKTTIISAKKSKFEKWLSRRKTALAANQ